MEKRIAELKNAAGIVNGELQASLSSLSRSHGGLKLPERVDFSADAGLDSFPEKDVEKVVRDGVEKGEIFFAVDPDFSGQVFEVKRSEAGGGKVIVALFPENFLQRADINGIRIPDALQKCLARIIFEDIKIQAEKLPRGVLRGSLTGLVGIFGGKITPS